MFSSRCFQLDNLVVRLGERWVPASQINRHLLTLYYLKDSPSQFRVVSEVSTKSPRELVLGGLRPYLPIFLSFFCCFTLVYFIFRDRQWITAYRWESTTPVRPVNHMRAMSQREIDTEFPSVREWNIVRYPFTCQQCALWSSVFIVFLQQGCASTT